MHDSPVAYFTIQFVLIALQRSNCVSSICNQLIASVQLDIPVHQAYVTRMLMQGISFILGHGVKPWILTQIIWPAGAISLYVITLVYMCASACESTHALIIMQIETI